MKEKLLYRGTKKLPEIFEQADINRMLNQAATCGDYWKKDGYKDWGEFFKMRDICLISTIYALGCRPLEACSLMFSDFNFKTMNVKIRGINNKCKKDRIIPVPVSLMKFYNLYFRFSRARFWRGSKYLFPSFSNSHISASRLKTIFREKILKPCGLWEAPEKGKIPKFRLYTLRHSRASHILEKQERENGQADIFAIANFLGHSDIRSTLVYLHTSKNYNEYLRKQTDF